MASSTCSSSLGCNSCVDDNPENSIEDTGDSNCISSKISNSNNSNKYNDTQSLRKRILEARIRWSNPLTDSATDEWNELFSEIGLELSHGNAQSLKPLLELFDELGPKKFLSLCLELIEINLRGHLLCWSWQYSKQNSNKLYELIDHRDTEMIQYVNKQAQFHECFPGNGKVGRVKMNHLITTSEESDTENNNTTSNKNRQSPPIPFFDDEETYDSTNYVDSDYEEEEEYEQELSGKSRDSCCGGNCNPTGSENFTCCSNNSDNILSDDNFSLDDDSSSNSNSSPNENKEESELVEESPAAELHRLMEEDEILTRARRWVLYSSVLTILGCTLAYQFGYSFPSFW